MFGNLRKTREVRITAQVAPVFEPLLADARYKGAHGGRGSGKSHFFGEHLIIDHCMMRPGLRAVCLRETQKSLQQSVKHLLESKIKQFNLNQYFQIHHNEIRTPGGGIIIFNGMQNHTADTIKSLEDFDIAWFEEAQAASARSWEYLRPTIRKPKSQIWASWNPDEEDDPVDNFFRGGEPPPNSIIVKANYLDNPWFKETALSDDMEYDKRRDYERYEHVWLGNYQTASEARVFKNWKIDYFDDPPKGTVFYYGADWGFANDPTVLVRCFIVGRILYIDRVAYKVGCPIDKLPALFDSIVPVAPDATPVARAWSIRADSARPETINYMQSHGYPKMVSAIKGPSSVEDGVEFIKSFDVVIHERCKHVIDEFQSYKYEIDPKTGEILPILEDKNNHVIDAVRYAVEEVRNGRKKMKISQSLLNQSRMGASQ